MSDLDLTSKLEQAFQSVVSALGVSGLAVLTGSDDATKTVPNCICAVEDIGLSDPQGSGNHRATVRIIVNSNAADTGLTAHRARVAAVFDGVMIDTIESSLSSAVSGLHVFDGSARGAGYGNDNTESLLTDWLTMQLYCCATDIS